MPLPTVPNKETGSDKGKGILKLASGNKLQRYFANMVSSSHRRKVSDAVIHETKSQGIECMYPQEQLADKHILQSQQRVLSFSIFGMTDMFDAEELRSRDSRLSVSSARSRSSSMSSVHSTRREDVDSEFWETGSLGSSSEPKEMCPFFIRGACRFRKNCRLSHEIGYLCPHCGEELPQRWTQQSKHLKRCWEEKVLVEEGELSQDLCLLAECDHSICVQCISPLWSPTTSIQCPVCSVASDTVIPRDRQVFDQERKLKMFGLYRKKLQKRHINLQLPEIAALTVA